MSYVLSVNSIKNWLSGIFGSGYQQDVIEQEPIIEEPIINIQEDITPPDISGLSLYYDAIMDNGKTIRENLNLPYAKKEEAYIFADRIRFMWGQWKDSDLSGYYYYFGENIFADPIKDGVFIQHGTGEVYSPEINFTKEGRYYLILKAKDDSQNISNAFIYEIYFSPYDKGDLSSISFFSDSSYLNPIKTYQVSFDKNITDKGIFSDLQQDAIICRTRLNNLYFSWDYSNNISDKYIILSKNQVGDKAFYSDYWNGYYMSPKLGLLDGLFTNSNKNSIKNLSSGKTINPLAVGWGSSSAVTQTMYPLNVYKKKETGIHYEFYVKPYFNDLKISADHRLFGVKYEPNLSEDISCIFHHWTPKMTCIDNNCGWELWPHEIIELEEINKIISPEIDENLNKSLRGLILLQVEKNGEAYYIYPNNSKKYYLGRPADAFSVMRKLGLGATHEFITSNTTFPDNILGKILLDVEQNGEAYYIYPKDKKAYYLGRPADAFRIMRELGLGITNSDLSKIPEGSLR